MFINATIPPPVGTCNWRLLYKQVIKDNIIKKQYKMCP